MCTLLLLFGRAGYAQSVTEPEMVFVAGGTFTMGCTFEQGGDCATDAKPSHDVQITGFLIAKHEVTQALWKQVMRNNPSRFKGDNLPVENVSWDDIQVFLQRLNAMTGKNYRLPTEAEWEYAARGGQKSQQTQFSGGFEIEDVAWCLSNSNNTTHSVGEKNPNEQGLYDMSGNVWEWCSDYYGTYSRDKQVNPTGPKKGSVRVVRGGCYAGNYRQCMVAARKSLYQGGKDFMTGFRLVMSDDREDIAAEALRQEEQARKDSLDASEQAEKERLVAEAKAEKDRVAAEKQAEKDRLAAAEQAEKDRIAAEKQAEKDRIAAAEQAEKDRIAAEKQAEKDRVAAEKQAEKDRVAAEKNRVTSVKQAKKEAHNRKVQYRRDSIRSMPSSTFFTLNAACSTIPQLSYGFKIGTVKVAGWYFSAMSNFNFNGFLQPLKDMNSYQMTANKSQSIRLSCLLGLAIRPCKAMSMHMGAGVGYRAMTVRTTDGWHTLPERTYYGADAAFGFMFHGKGFALSIEAVYNVPFDLDFGKMSPISRLEGKLGIGFMLPNKKSRKK